MSNFQHNSVFDLAVELVNYTDKHVFLTGKAGTGKTTFLKHIVSHTHKNTIVAAPTGVAAINAGGTTLHSLLNLPFGVFVPDGSRPYGSEWSEEINDRQSLIRRIKLSGNKKKVLQALELLIIDEVSMVRADLLDMVDAVLRFARKSPHAPFGGVQVLYIGDMFQLPPVVKDNNRELLSRFYTSPFFFDAKVIKQAPPEYIELTQVYRQRDETFVELLNEVRNNQLSERGWQQLSKRLNPGFSTSGKDGYITLTTHNYIADQINQRELNVLKGRPFKYTAEIAGDFPEQMYPVDSELHLKPGAQVMFVKNDLETPKRFYNGKIGKICSLEADTVEVQCEGDQEPIKVPLETWENMRYRFDALTRTVEDEVLGSFKQFPLRLAWAITIHKSQGLTFQQAVIDAGRAFEAGQVYVALSRCTSLEGLVLKSAIPRGLVMTHERIAQFSRRDRSTDKLPERVAEAKILYLRQQIEEVFQLNTLFLAFGRLRQLFIPLDDMFNNGAGEIMQQIEANLQNQKEAAKERLNKVQVFLAQTTIFEKNAGLNSLLEAQAPVLGTFLSEEVNQLWRKMPGLKQGFTKKSAEAYFAESEVFSNLLYNKIQKCRRLYAGFSLELFFKKGIGIEPRGFQQEKQIKPVAQPKSADISCQLFEEGKTPDEIAAERNLALSTIFAHLCEGVEQGRIDINKLIPLDTIKLIERALPENPHEVTNTSAIKLLLGDEVSYHEIRCVLARKKLEYDGNNTADIRKQQKLAEVI